MIGDLRKVCVACGVNSVRPGVGSLHITCRLCYHPMWAHAQCREPAASVMSRHEQSDHVLVVGGGSLSRRLARNAT